MDKNATLFGFPIVVDGSLDSPQKVELAVRQRLALELTMEGNIFILREKAEPRIEVGDLVIPANSPHAAIFRDLVQTLTHPRFAGVRVVHSVEIDRFNNAAVVIVQLNPKPESSPAVGDETPA